jgi:hypothetical protein
MPGMGVIFAVGAPDAYLGDKRVGIPWGSVPPGNTWGHNISYTGHPGCSPGLYARAAPGYPGVCAATGTLSSTWGGRYVYPGCSQAGMLPYCHPQVILG